MYWLNVYVIHNDIVVYMINVAKLTECYVC